MSTGHEWQWDKIGALLTVVVIVLYCVVEFLLPLVRRRRLKHPCKAFFEIRELLHGDLGYVIQDEKAHHLKELVLPSNSIVMIEVLYYPTIDFTVEETVFGCEGDRDSKPEAEKRISRFIEKGKNEWEPGVDESDMTNIKGYYHFRSRFSAKAEGDCFTTGFMLRTKKAGVYKTSLGFLTDEISCGADDLTIRVEDNPSTRMKCSLHWGCYVTPVRIP